MTEQKPRPYKHPQFNLRIPENLKQDIAKIAKLNGRSINAEMVKMLELSVSEFLFHHDDPNYTELAPDEFYSNEYITISRNDLKSIIEKHLNDFKVKLLANLNNEIN